MTFALLRVIGLVGAFTVGGLLPQLSGFSWLIRFGLIFMLFTVYLRIELSRRMFHRSQPLAIIFGILLACGAWAGLGAAGYPELAKVAFFTAITPTATAAPVIVSIIGGNITYTATLFLLSNLSVSLCLPVLIPCVIGDPAIGLAGDVLMRVLTVTLAPLAVALAVRWYSKDIARKLGERLSPLTFYVWISIVVLIAAQARHFIDQQAQVPWDLLGAIAGLALVICVINFVTGYFLGRPKYGLECSQGLGQKNNSLTVYLALTYADPVVALGPTVYVLWHNIWNAIQIFRAGKPPKP
jgi:BASS family bile acid:Na+ symporter